MHTLLLIAALFTAPITPKGQSSPPPFILTTAAAVDPSACCRPDGTAHATINFIFSVSLRQVQPQFFGRQMALAVRGNDPCLGIGQDLIPSQTFRNLIDSEGPHVRFERRAVLKNCPVGAKAWSVARFWHDTKRDESECARPCPECEPWEW